ncbi:hypothetical protein R0137_05210 [Congregibacter brevis]|uniref:Uncharacterized protein n=1 Tax=Congregibacter brevis TaxID=3081201 RepID=A0ABZ0IEI4_9GAMM|nr:hypothetical protein R0137_05210 [Congregibacter sp. IMCC45268]
MKLALQIAGGILIASAVLFLVRVVFFTAAITAFSEEVDKMGKAAQAQADKRVAERIEAQRKESAMRAEKVRQIQVAEEAKRRADQYERDKRAEFDSGYIMPDGCENPRNETAFVECANHKLRARKEFYANFDGKRLSL